MEKIIEVAVIGADETILLYNAVGIRAFSVQDASEADKTIFKLANQKCKIIYITESIYELIPETIEKYQFSTFPVLIPIPSGTKSRAIGLKKIKKNVENAIGIDIF
ncbi:MAG: V-type ATP synthase subunit F [Candidatus Izemoplasmatales bacterium]|nr:V-type ATP synthase subunit F [Candidatus Izemoplasmatales bacterium]MDD4595292.1 V-type ATP synthase subunit F [Candidatus Izemoplasmatales bacterium]